MSISYRCFMTSLHKYNTFAQSTLILSQVKCFIYFHIFIYF